MSTQKSIATVSKQGIVKGIKGGTAKINVTVKKNSKITKLTYKITVKKPVLSKSKLSLVSGKTTSLSVKNKPKKASYTWQSGNAKVATVNKNGKVVAKTKGTASIKVKVKAAKRIYSLSCKVTVKSAPNNVQNTYKVAFNSNGGSAVASQTVKKNSYAKQPAAPTRKGYSFDGWYTAAKGGKKFNFKTAITRNVTLYAHWTEIVVDFGNGPFEVIFFANDGSDGTYEKQSIKKEGLVCEPESPVRDMYRFTGWYTEPEAVNRYDFNTPCNNSFVLYAGWGNPDGSDDLYAASDNEETIYSITAIEVKHDNVIVTYNTNSKCLMTVEFFEDEMSGSDWSEKAQISNLNSVPITTTCGYTENYGEMITIALPINDTLPDNYVVRATLYETGEDENPVYVTFKYTDTYEKFETQTLDSVTDKYGEERVINFDNDRVTNFGVLKDSVKTITTDRYVNGFKITDVEIENDVIPEHRFVFDNADEIIQNLKVGEIIYLEGTNWIFRIGTITNDNGTVTLTQDKNTEMTDFYDVLKVEMDGQEVSSNDITKKNNASGISAQAEIIDIDDVNLSAGFSENISYELENGITFEGIIEGKITGSVTMYYDAHLFSDDYFECSVTCTTEASVNGSAELKTGNGDDVKFLKKKWGIASIKIPTTIIGLEIYAKPSTELEWEISGGVSIKINSKQTSGFKYNSDYGLTDIKKKENTVSLMAEGKAEVKFGPNIDIGIEFLGGVFNAGITAELGAKFSATAETGVEDFTNTIDSKHACTCCISGKAEWYATADIKFGYSLSEKLKW